MKKSRQKSTLRTIFNNGFILVALEIFFFLCTPCCKGILAPLYYKNSIGIIGDILFRIVFYVIYVFEIYILLSEIIHGKFYSTFMRKPKELIMKIAICRIAIDLLNLCVYQLFVEPVSAFAICLTEISFISFTFYLTAYFISEEKFRFIKNKSTMTTITISVALVIFCGIFFATEYKTYYDIILKYTPSSDIYIAYFENLPFRMELLSLIVMCFFSIACFACFYIAMIDCGCVANRKKRSKKSEVFERAFALFLCAIFLYIVKMIIYPIGGFVIVPHLSTLNNSTDKETRSFSYEYVEVEAERFSKYGFEKNVVMNKTYPKITYRNKSTLNITFYSPLDNTLSYPLNNIDIKYTEYDSEFSSSNIIHYGNFGIVFLEGDTARSVKTENIDNHKENHILTEAVKKMISDGYWDYFEYGSKYLLKYDPEFIKPYIQRYANGDFSDNELQLNKDIKTEYMIDFANRMVEYEKIKN